MRFLLDTDTCVFALKEHPRVREHLLSHRRTEIGISAISEAELRVGAAKSRNPAKQHRAIDDFLLPIDVIEFTSLDATAYGELRARLERSGTPIGDLDTLIAAQALAWKLVLVTNNERELRRVPGLKVENWTRA